MNLTTLNTKNIRSVTCLALALYELVMEQTQGRARKAAECLCVITSLELDGCRPPASIYCTLALMALSDLVAHAPCVKIIVSNWPEDYHCLARNDGECAAQSMAAVLTWAGWRWGNIQLGMPPDMKNRQVTLPLAQPFVAA